MGAESACTPCTDGRSPRFPIEALRGEMRLERRLAGWDQLLQCFQGQAGHIQELHGAGLHIGQPYTGHTWGLLAWKAQHTKIGIHPMVCVFVRGLEYSTSVPPDESGSRGRR